MLNHLEHRNIQRISGGSDNVNRNINCYNGVLNEECFCFAHCGGSLVVAFLFGSLLVE